MTKDNGTISGMDNHVKLMDEMPPKISNLMDITVIVNTKDEKDLNYIEILALHYTFSISSREKYYFWS